MYGPLEQAQNKGMPHSLLAKLFAADAKLLAEANLILKGDVLKNDYKVSLGGNLVYDLSDVGVSGVCARE